MFVDAELAYNFDEISRLRLGVGNQFKTTADNQSIEALSIEVVYERQLRENIEMFALVGYSDIDFSRLGGGQVREDEVYSAALGGTYSFWQDRMTLDGVLRYTTKTPTQTAPYMSGCCLFWNYPCSISICPPRHDS